MGQAMTDDIQQKVDDAIVDKMTEYKEEFEKYSKLNGAMGPYKYSPFELFQLQKLAILNIGIDHMKVRIANEVKELLNDFIEQVNEIATEPSKKD